MLAIPLLILFLMYSKNYIMKSFQALVYACIINLDNIHAFDSLKYTLPMTVTSEGLDHCQHLTLKVLVETIDALGHFETG